MAVCRASQRNVDEAAASRHATPCVTLEQVKRFEDVGCAASVPVGLRWAALLRRLLLHACLRFTSQRIELGASSIYGYCWGANRKRAVFRFAALQKGFSENAWADFVMPPFSVDFSRRVRLCSWQLGALSLESAYALAAVTLHASPQIVTRAGNLAAHVSLGV